MINGINAIEWDSSGCGLVLLILWLIEMFGQQTDQFYEQKVFFNSTSIRLVSISDFEKQKRIF